MQNKLANILFITKKCQNFLRQNKFGGENYEIRARYPLMDCFHGFKKNCRNSQNLREAAKEKSSFLSGRATKRGGGLNRCQTKEK